jgi:uncharacterized Zn finger protein
LVRILLWEGNVDQAWHEAQQGGCTASLWEELAQQRAEAHPEDAITAYQRVLQTLLTQTGEQTYDRIVGLLSAMRPLLIRVGRGNAFTEYVAAICKEQRRKRNLMRRLDEQGW